MSATSGWNLLVPDTGDELLAELRRHGVEVGQRLRVVAVAADSGAGVDRGERRSRFRFAGIVKDGPTDVASTVDEHLAEGFGRS